MRKLWISIGTVCAALTIVGLGYPTFTSAEGEKNIEQMIAEAETSADHEATQEPVEQEGSMSMHGRQHGKHHGGMAGMHKRHEQMMTKRKAMLAELQQQLAALHEHTETLEGLTDQQQVLTAMKEHQQMTDALLTTMIEQRLKMHEAMQAHHEKMKEKMGKEGQVGTQKSGCCAKVEASAEQTQEDPQEHEAHHSSE